MSPLPQRLACAPQAAAGLGRFLAALHAARPGQMARLDQACVEVGRDPTSLRRLVLSGARLDSGLGSIEAFRHTAECYAEAGATDFVVHWPRPHEPYAADLSTFERIFSG